MSKNSQDLHTDAQLTMCLKSGSEKGLAHISECPLPVGGMATATTLGVDFSNASDPLDGIFLRKRPNSPLQQPPLAPATHRI